jgi:aspartate aminotransferase
MAARALVDRLRGEGHDIVDFTIGEPDLPTPPHIVEAAIAAMRRGETKYTGASGTSMLRRAIADKLARENDLSYPPSEIVVGAGGKQIIFTALAATLNEGDEVILPAPYWVSYPDMALINGALPVVVRCDESQGFKLRADALEMAITPRTKWLILNSPCNPTGAVYDEAELRALAAVLRRHPHVWLMTDEIYEHFVYGGARHIPILKLAPDLRERTLVVNGVSKTYSMTGWRIGYGAGPSALIAAIAMLLSQSTTCPSAISQTAAAAAFVGDQSCVEDAVSLYSKRRDRIVGLLREIPGFRCIAPDGAFYVYPSVEGLLGRTRASGERLASDLDVVRFLLEEAKVATIDGGAYGLSPYLRLSFATSQEAIEDGCARIKRACGALTK